MSALATGIISSSLQLEPYCQPKSIGAIFELVGCLLPRELNTQLFSPLVSSLFKIIKEIVYLGVTISVPLLNALNICSRVACLIEYY